MSVISEQLRREFLAGDTVRDAGLETPEDVVRFDDISYGAHFQQALDVYRPRGREGALPVIVNVHGGGWVYGDKERYQYYAMSLCRRGFAVVNFSYRLAPESRWPAQMEDVNAAFAWTRAHAEAYGFDTKNIFAVGDSAGGHLLSLYCDICTNPEYAEAFTFRPGPAPKAVSLACGNYLIGFRAGEDTRHALLLEDLTGGPVTEETVRFLNVAAHMTGDFPETFLFTCTGDMLQEEARLMEAALTEHSVPHVLRFYGDRSRSLGHVFHCNMKMREAEECNDEQCAFFRRIAERG